MTEKKIYDPDIEANKTFAAMSYLWILCLVPLLLRRSSKFAQFHAKQGLVLFLAELLVGMVMWIPLIGQILLFACILVAALGFLKAMGGEWWKIPFIYQWSEKIKI